MDYTACHGSFVIHGNCHSADFIEGIKSEFPDTKVHETGHIISCVIYSRPSGASYTLANLRYFKQGSLGLVDRNVELVGSSLPKDGWRPIVERIITLAGLEDIIRMMEDGRQNIRFTVLMDPSAILLHPDLHKPGCEEVYQPVPAGTINVCRQ